jgi:hypothetical protein
MILVNSQASSSAAKTAFLGRVQCPVWRAIDPEYCTQAKERDLVVLTGGADIRMIVFANMNSIPAKRDVVVPRDLGANGDYSVSQGLP